MGKTALSNLSSLNLKDLFDLEFRPREDVLKPWLRTEDTCILWAASGVGKTMLSLSIALAVAGGGSVVDWSAPTARRVLYVDGEMHLQDIHDRLVTLRDQQSILTSPKEESDALENLIVLARQHQRVGASFFDLTDVDSQNALIKRIKLEEAELVILDNFTTLSDSLQDENDAVAFKQVQDFFLKLKRLGIATILVHHANKGGKAMRGSTALETTFEVVLGLKRPKVASPGQATFVTVFSKFRSKGANQLEERTWALEDDGWRVSEYLPEDPHDDPVYLALKSLEYTSNIAIGEKLGINKSTVGRKIKKFEALGVLKVGEAKELLESAKMLAIDSLNDGINCDDLVQMDIPFDPSIEEEF